MRLLSNGNSLHLENVYPIGIQLPYVYINIRIQGPKSFYLVILLGLHERKSWRQVSAKMISITE
jgi:hypothetical protein